MRIAQGNGPWSVPHAQIVLPASAPTAEWLATRTLGLGGSDASSLMGDSHWDDATPWHCWATKTGRYEKNLTGAMERGHALEPIVLGRWKAQHGHPYRRAGLMRSRRNPVLQGSVDALCACGGINEAKTTTKYVQKVWPEPGDGPVCSCGCGAGCPPEWAWQARHYLLVTGRTVVHVVAVVVEDWSLHSWNIDRDEAQLAYLERVESDFWATYVATDTEPPFDQARYTASEVADRWRIDNGLQIEAPDPLLVLQLLHERANAKTAERASKAASAPIDLALKALIGPASHLTVNGEVAYTYKTTKETTIIDYKAAWEAQATDLAAYTSKKPGNRTLSVKLTPGAAEVAELATRQLATLQGEPDWLTDDAAGELQPEWLAS